MELFMLILMAAIILGLIFPKRTFSIMCASFVVLFKGLYVIVVTGLIVSLTNCPQMYRAIGFTPISLMFGDSVYASSKPMPKDKKRQSKPKQTKRTKSKTAHNTGSKR